MTRTMAALTLLVLSVTGTVLFAQGGARPMSPDGTAHAQVLGKWVKGERPSFALGRENYQRPAANPFRLSMLPSYGESAKWRIFHRHI